MFISKYSKLGAICLLFSATVSSAEVLPHHHINESDDRITHFHYKNGEVYRVDLNYRFITEVRFEKGETVTNIQLGDSTGFQVTRLGSGEAVTIKPVDAIGVTNMNIETNRRRYSFLLNAVDDENITAKNFRVSFKYPNSARKKASFSDLTSGTQATGKVVNADYLIGGYADFAPYRVYDDGVNTWIQFTTNARRPAMFSVNKKGEESVVNYTAHPNHWIQIHGLSNRWILRIDDEAICIHKEKKSY